ncbi:permease-like cell division protein FtsX [Rathayibacter toxicus]|uniref:Cell division protein FtsX n=1 Tax=Rathayibacter toxicus TaxID=145458 RepID=A0A0C5BDM2_9MICO|nr:permease-like cell division protein FtsX [Rathayibacter toxicus]AJM77346.1 cell division protein FtsX [Rathayibacter toxicus]ALS56770.1 cell division protein FtsX [Rathayibacter toxicus]KKM46383.1 cell division protein FtsX [Rathayibacter toxicus]PPG23369.1 ABC transporter permease [Rathayibacter toxicus]PPG47953.1 ABC transporter permease [Rathayibacter toxicus]
MRFALIWSEVASGLRRNVSMVISVILVTFISLTFVGTAMLLQMQIGQMKNFWYDKAQVAVYLCTTNSKGPNCSGSDATKEQIDTLKKQLDGPTLAPYIDRSYFENHDQAFTNFQQQFKGNPVAQYVTPDLLNQTFWINLKDPTRSDVIIESLSKVSGVESVTDQRQYLDRIFAILSAASYTAIGIAVLMLVAAVLLIATTIRLSAFSRRRELGIMRLVGASNRFIQTPFILEGVFAALVGSILAGLAIVAIVRFFVQGFLLQRIQSIAFVGLDDALLVVPILILTGVVLAAISANVAISRYLRV